MQKKENLPLRKINQIERVCNVNKNNERNGICQFASMLYSCEKKVYPKKKIIVKCFMIKKS
jgi:hypothetical protein